MITSIKIGNNTINNYAEVVGEDQSSSAALLVSISEPNVISFGVNEELPAIGTQYLERLLTRRTGLHTINNISPNTNGNFYILGSTCTSVTDQGSNSLVIFDGCVPCQTCKTLAQLQQDLQQAVIWANGMKDCNLYYDATANRLWRDMLNKRTQQGANCAVQSNLKPSLQESQVGTAIKLLHQYKAAVAMWNYLVAAGNATTQILQATQDYGGFVLQSKHRWNFCGRNSGGVTLKVQAYLQSGQTPTFLQSLTPPFAISAHVSSVQANTYMEYGTDKGPNGGLIDDSGITSSFSVSRDQTLKITALFTFTPRYQADVIFSASFKVLPVVWDLNGSYQAQALPQASCTRVTLDQWAALRAQATSILKQEQTSTNQWRIEVTWAAQGNSEQQTLTYLTGFSKHPPYEESDSSESGVE